VSEQTDETTGAGTATRESDRGGGTVPRGVEVLLKKAAVDAEFRDRLLDERGFAAAAIELELDPAESAMLRAISRQQLEYIVSQTVVPVEQRRVFLGRLAAPMLAVVGVAVTGCANKTIGVTPLGGRPDMPPTNQPPAGSLRATDGIRPDIPQTNRPPAKMEPSVTNDPPRPGTEGIRPDRP
jgi:hypothetical protein